MESDAKIRLSPEDRARLEGWVAGRSTPQKLVWRARIALMWAQAAKRKIIQRCVVVIWPLLLAVSIWWGWR